MNIYIAWKGINSGAISIDDVLKIAHQTIDNVSAPKAERDFAKKVIDAIGFYKKAETKRAEWAKTHHEKEET